MIRRRAPVALAFVVALVVGSVGVAHAADDGLVLPGEKVRTVLVGGETRMVAVAGIEGGRYTLTVKAVGKSRARPRFDVVAPDGTALGDRGRIRESARGASARNLRVDLTGVWRVAVSTPVSGGGEVEFAVKADVPSRRKLVGEASGDPASGTASFPALPGSTIDLDLAFTAKRAPPMTLSLRAPGVPSPVASASGDAGKAALRKVALGNFGVHEVRVGGGSGTFRGTVRFRGPAKRKGLSLDAVEAFPVVTDASPRSVANDGERSVVFQGFGFSSRQRVALTRDGVPVASAAFDSFDATTARARFDLEEDPSGVHGLALLLPPSRRVELPWTIDVTNLPPGVLTQFPPDAPNDADVDLRLDGVGFDPGATVEVRRAADGLEIPVLSVTRSSHRLLEAILRPPKYAAGPCDVTIVDGDGRRFPRPASLDLLGARRPSEVVRTIGTPGTFTRSAACDAASGRALVSVVDSRRVAFLLVDTATCQVVDTFEPPPASPAVIQKWPSVAFHPRNGTWAAAWVEETGITGDQRYRGNVCILERGDLSGVRAAFSVGSAWLVDRVAPAPDGKSGGWHFYWTEFRTSDLSSLKLLRTDADGIPADGGAVTLEAWQPGLVVEADADQLADGRFVVVYVSHPADGVADLVVLRLVVNADGTPSGARLACATEDKYHWSVWVPQVAAHPTDGSACVAFTWGDDQRLHAASVRLSPETATPGSVSALAPVDEPAGSFLADLVWNGDRQEYVACVGRQDDYVEIRRLGPDGRLRGFGGPLVFEGVEGAVWAGAGTLGLARLFDGTADGYHIRSSSSFQVVCTPLR